MRKSYTFLLVSLCFVLTAHAQNYSLNLTGLNYVTAGVDVINPNGDFTIEFWAYVPHAKKDGAIHQMVSEGSTGLEFAIGYLGDGTIQVGDPANFPGTGVAMPFDSWTHIALTFSGASSAAKLYLNGAPMAQVDGFFFTDDQPFRIGVQTDLQQPLTGNIDEVKAWNTVRTRSQIRSDMFNAPAVSDNTLVAYYTMNDGAGTGVNNSAGSTGNSQDGNISGDTGGANSWGPSPIQFGNNGLLFDGVADQVNIPALADLSYDLSTVNGGTVEFWVNPTTLSTSWSTVLGNRGSGGVRYSFHLSNTQIGLDNGTTINTLDYAVPAGTSTWTHLAFVMDGGTNTTVYVNGISQGTITGTLGGATGQPITLGIAKNKTGPDDKPFAGGIDEVRIWNYQRTASQILTFKNNSLAGTESGLLAQYTFDQGVSNGNDFGLATAFDNTAQANDGTLTNFDLSGATPTFIEHDLAPEPLPVTLTKFAATRSGNESVLQWETATEENTRDFSIERSTDGKTYEEIGTVAAAGNSKTLLDYTFTDPQPQMNTDYYRLKQVDLDGNFVYSPVRIVNFPSTSKMYWYATGRGSAEILLQQGDSQLYTLFDAAGHLLRSGNLSNGRTRVSQLPPGIYFVRVATTTIEISLP